ncbi:MULTISPECIES: glycoside hydrolase family 32 protein [Arthrobacter]|uniref:beta-fructofuranosidase n=1 Tax=Arthrobacter terricola TaxID=2547396 RepID=A0A4R5KHQ3_9MICC|nr:MULTISPECIES: glycoside hydrolase family 32 protein [Arthrobacter]MBT8159178.1 glycoside hydrolase family 32 protein [Arthrobacter sp. GN70]TDF94981.1 glycoside hydrolase family 32 protein [Arthrobacter terricola]
MTDLISSTPSLAMTAIHPDPAFPRFHPRPAQGWINDPNGVSYINGRYHVFFQYNPESARHHRIHWGHVSSPDLVTWDEHPVALRPQDGGPDEYGCWTGVVTDDGGVPTAAYSGVTSGHGHSQVVISRGSADLVTWEQIGHVAASMPADPLVTAVRDPFLFRFNGKRYAMQGAGLANGHAALLLYSVEDMSSWKYEGIWLTTENPVAASHTPAEIWECPQLVRVPSDGDAEDGGETWVMMFSLWLSGDDHEHANGVGHLIGSLTEDPQTGLPIFTPRSGGSSDLGRDFYAPQIVQLESPTAGPKALLWGWANEGPGRDGRRGRTQEEIDAAGWAGVLTHPRVLSVEKGELVVSPAPEVEAYRGPLLAEGAAGTVSVPAFAEALISGASGEVQLVLASGTERQVVFTGQMSRGEELRIFVDASLVEVYRTGSVATTLRAYPAPGEEWILELPEGAAASVWELRLPE